MYAPDRIFEEPWSLWVQEGKGGLGELIEKTEESWGKIKARLPKLETALETMHRASKEMASIKNSMENAKEEILRIESMTEVTEKEIETRTKALKILKEIAGRIKISKEEIQLLQEPAFNDMNEVAKIEEVLVKVKKCLSIENPRILSLEIVRDQQEVVRKVSERFEKKIKEFIMRDCLKNKKNPTDVHNVLSRYTELIRYLVENKSFQECWHAYSATLSKLHRNYMRKKIEEVVAPFKKNKGRGELTKKIEEAVIGIVQLFLSLATTEGYFLTEIFTAKETGPGTGTGAVTNAQMAILREMFEQTAQEILGMPKVFYDMSYEVEILNVLSSKSDWMAESSTPSEEIGRQIAGNIIPKMRKEVRGFMTSYLQKIKKTIGKEYSKEGAIDLDRTFYNIVDISKVAYLNTEILKINLAYSAKIKTHTERVFQTIKRACILGSIQAHYLENREIYEAEVNELLEEEIEKMTNNLMYLAEEKVFEKPKISSIVKRTKEIMDFLNKVEDPLGFRLQISFKDMILSKALFHQRNEIAAVLTENKKEE